MPGLDLQCAYVVLFPSEDPDYVYLLFYSDHPEYKKAWDTLDAEYWGYWNNTDPPEDITWEDFKARGKLWESAFDKLPPSRVGLTFEVLEADFTPPMCFLDKEKIEQKSEELDFPALTTSNLCKYVPKKSSSETKELI